MGIVGTLLRGMGRCVGAYALPSAILVASLAMVACAPEEIESIETAESVPSGLATEAASEATTIAEPVTIASDPVPREAPDTDSSALDGVAEPRVQPRITSATTLERASSYELSVVVASILADMPDYIRDEWRHWIDEDGDCMNTRHEVLLEESVRPVTFADSDQCKIESGSWIGPFTGKQFDDPGVLDIDHMVPLKNAHLSGGWAWGRERKADYANDLSYDGHLLAVDRSANRSKGSSGPEDWRPLAEEYRCQYAIDWVTIKYAWRLTVSEPEAAALVEMLNTCMPPRSLVIAQSSVSEPLVMPSPTSTPSSESYASCEEAEAAGEPLVRGPVGSGWGFLESKVPSARDGDGDGIVCER